MTRSELATKILASPKIKLATVHASGHIDNANAKQVIKDTSEGHQAHRSSFGTAPGGTVDLDVKMLTGMLTLAESFSFSVSEVCGGEHSLHSRHYNGVAFDVNVIDGTHIDIHHPKFHAFMNKARALGATEIIGPPSQGHTTHVHCAWPRV
jgi:zinc D-Ala-D-Ala carboxypeptidase